MMPFDAFLSFHRISHEHDELNAYTLGQSFPRRSGRWQGAIDEATFDEATPTLSCGMFSVAAFRALTFISATRKNSGSDILNNQILCTID